MRRKKKNTHRDVLCLDEGLGERAERSLEASVGVAVEEDLDIGEVFGRNGREQHVLGTDRNHKGIGVKVEHGRLHRHHVLDEGDDEMIEICLHEVP